MKISNKVWLTAGLSIMMSLCLVGCDFVDKSAAEYYQASQQYFDQGNYTASLIEIKNALQKQPADATLRILAAKIHLKLGSGIDAESELRKALASGAQRVDVQALQAQAMYQQRHYKQLLNRLALAAELSPQNHSIALVYKGLAATELKEYDKARQLIQQALKLDQNNQLAKRGLAMLLSAEGKVDAAIKLTDDLLKEQPDNRELFSLRGDFMVAAGRYPEARANYTQVITNYQDNYLDLAKRALVCIKENNEECAQADLQGLKQKAPRFYMTAYLEGLIAVQQKRWKDAQLALSQALAINAGLTPAYYFAGLTHYQQQQYGPAIGRLTSYLAIETDSVNGRHLLSLAQLKEGHLEAAKTTLAPVLKQGNVDPAILYIMGQIEYALGHISESVTYFKQLSLLQPESALVHAQLGLKMMASGNKLGGLDQLAVAIDLAPDFIEAGQVSVLAYLDAGQFQQAQSLIDRMRQQKPDSVMPLNLQGVLYLQQGNESQAIEFFEKALKLVPADPTSAHNLAQLLLKRGDIQRSFRLYQDVLAEHPQHVPSQLKLADLELKLGKKTEAESRLVQLIKTQKDALAPRLMLAEFYLVTGRTDGVEETLEPIRALYPKDPRILRLIAESLLARGLPGQAKQAARSLVIEQPDSADAHWMLARASLADKDGRNGAEELERTLEINPDHIPARMVKIKMLGGRQQFSEAQQQLNQLLKFAPGDPRVVSLAAWMSMFSGDANKAVTAYGKAFEFSPSAENAMGLALAQWQSGQKEAAVSTLNTWTTKHPEDEKAQFRLGMFYLTMGYDGDASKRFLKVLQFQPDNVVALNNMAWLLRKENPQKSMQYIEKAAQLAPKEAAVFDTLGMVMLEQGQTARALRVLERAFKEHPDHPAIQYHMAIALQRNGKEEQSITVLQHLLKAYPDFEYIGQVRSLLKQMNASGRL